MTTELTKQMMTELKFYEVDETKLGEESETEIEEDEDQEAMAQSMAAGLDQPEIEGEEAQNFLAKLLGDSDERDLEMQKIKLDELNISDYQIEPEIEQSLTDFPVKTYPDPRKPEADPLPNIPIDYYDNDDGFWDEYIAKKRQKWAEHDMIVFREFFKH